MENFFSLFFFFFFFLPPTISLFFFLSPSRFLCLCLAHVRLSSSQQQFPRTTGCMATAEDNRERHEIRIHSVATQIFGIWDFRLRRFRFDSSSTTVPRPGIICVRWIISIGWNTTVESLTLRITTEPPSKSQSRSRSLMSSSALDLGDWSPPRVKKRSN